MKRPHSFLRDRLTMSMVVLSTSSKRNVGSEGEVCTFGLVRRPPSILTRCGRGMVALSWKMKRGGHGVGVDILRFICSGGQFERGL